MDPEENQQGWEVQEGCLKDEPFVQSPEGHVCVYLSKDVEAAEGRERFTQRIKFVSAAGHPLLAAHAAEVMCDDGAQCHRDTWKNQAGALQSHFRALVSTSKQSL